MSTVKRNETLTLIRERRVSAIIRTDDQRIAADAMSAAVRGGFQIVEFTLTTPGALELIHEFSAREHIIVGAGTVLDPQQATDAAHAGARFLVSPVFDPEVVAAARALDVVSIPGAFTPAEMLRAHRAGADLIKLFPFPWPERTAEYIKSILGPLPELNIYPTSGVTVDNLIDVLRAGAVGAGFVRALFDPEALLQHDFQTVEQNARAIMDRLETFPYVAPEPR